MTETTFPTPRDIADSYNKRWEALKEEAQLIVAASMVSSYREQELKNGTKFKGGTFTLVERFFVIRGWIVLEFAKAGWAVDTTDLFEDEIGNSVFNVHFENRQV